MGKRRTFLKQLGLGGLSTGLLSGMPYSMFTEYSKDLDIEISLAQFSFASEFFTGKHNTLEFPARAKEQFGINAVEYVSMFFADKAKDASFFKELKMRTEDLGVANHLIMVDDENIANLDKEKRKHAVESHYKWVDAANILGCSSIRVNLGSLQQEGTAEEVAAAALEGYSSLLDFGEQNNMNIIVENHVGHSCNGKWLAGIMKEVNHKRAGVLPDFGNFCLKRTKPETMDLAGYMNTKCLETYDMYLGVQELMPYAKGVSAKTHKFDSEGKETEIDFSKMFEIIKNANFSGYIGVEYEGGIYQMQGKEGYLSNSDGIVATKQLIEKYL
ncbi:sugar phosphate isomerase/epimerase family protein [Eudoraea chungangensis]|uniref:sugar phosphate isomerase/epimerase family protein n=1 Tax=Eudoraea chungangensis TaxID=1481905 RepID=UPI0023EAAB5B|nr:TIM barrel protein [Eudoraea chungangensis]